MEAIKHSLGVPDPALYETTSLRLEALEDIAAILDRYGEDWSDEAVRRTERRIIRWRKEEGEVR